MAERGLDLSRLDLDRDGDRRQLAWYLTWTFDRSRSADLMAVLHCILEAAPKNEQVRRQALWLCRELVFPTTAEEVPLVRTVEDYIASYEAHFGHQDPDTLQRKLDEWVKNRKKQPRSRNRLRK